MNIIKTNTKRNNYTNVIYKNTFLSEEQRYREMFSKITNAFLQIEYLSVIEGVRNACLMFIRPDQLEHQKEKFKAYDLDIVLLNKETYDINGGYGNHNDGNWDGTENYVWRAIITKQNNIDKWKNIWNTRNDSILFNEYKIGIELGYPDCCCKFFTEVWMKNGGVDTTWQQALNTVYPVSQKDAHWWNFSDSINTHIHLPESTSVWANNLLRWAGLKLVTHLPCSFDCKETKRIALENLGIATKYGFGNEYKMLCDVLNWDITWTAQYGIATIDTPIFTINTVTDITTEKYVVHKKGNNIL